MYIVDFESCPHCRCPIEARLFAISSLLGPSQVDCLKCRGSVRLDRSEWSDMTFKGRVWFLLVTLTYVLMVGVLTGNFVDQIWQLCCLDERIVNMRTGSPIFRTAACVGALSVIPLQIYRIFESGRRSRSEYKLTMFEFLFGLQWNLQAKCLLLLLLVWGIAKVYYSLSSV